MLDKEGRALNGFRVGALLNHCLRLVFLVRLSVERAGFLATEDTLRQCSASFSAQQAFQTKEKTDTLAGDPAMRPIRSSISRRSGLASQAFHRPTSSQVLKTTQREGSSSARRVSPET